MGDGISKKLIDYVRRLISTIEGLDTEQVCSGIAIIRDAWLRGNQVICFGNGGSALTSQHYVTDWNKAVYHDTGRPFHGRCLADNIGIVSAYGNDFSYEDIFVQQLKPILNSKDVVIGVSGSGNSENVIRAIQYANDNGAISLGICGFDGGRLRRTAQHSLWVNVNDMQIAEDLHMIFGHLVMQAICESY